MENSQKIKFNKTHEWVKFDKGTAYIGISDHAQESLGDVVFFEIEANKNKFEKGETIGSIESVKAVSEIYAPIKCQLIEINPKLQDDPGIINSSPQSEGWLLKVQPLNVDDKDSNNLMDEADYKNFVDTQ